MLTRILTALVLIPIALALVLWASEWLFLVGLLPFVFLAAWEYLTLMARAGAAPARWSFFAIATGLLLVAAFRPGQILATVVVGALIFMVVEMARRAHGPEIPIRAAACALGLLYVVVPFALVLDLRRLAGPWVVVYLLLLVWIGDTAAYFVGRAVGRRKLSPVLSPGKTVEGTLGSVVITVAAGFALYRGWFPSEAGSTVHAILLPLVVNVAAQVGDLAESALKRAAGVKDSSALLPGHGGMLDRIDALLFAAPVLWYYWTVFFGA